jgi:hypothetical protein
MLDDTLTREKLCHIRLDNGIRSAGYGAHGLYASICWVIKVLAHEVRIELQTRGD